MSYATQLNELRRILAAMPQDSDSLRLEANLFEAQMDAQLGLSTAPEGHEWVAPKRITKMNLGERQLALWNATCRFATVPAGRRSGKTELSKRRLVGKSIMEERHDDAWFIAAAPTLSQAKRIFWRDLKAMSPKRFVTNITESGEPTIEYFNGARLTVMGMEVPERAEGSPLNGIVLDEYGNMKEDVWDAHVRPALTDRKGWAWFTGVPEGRNHYYDLSTSARLDTTGEWGNYTWWTEHVLHLYLGKAEAEAELASAQSRMDPLTYDQEYRASFVTFEGLAYYGWGDWNISRNLIYRPESDLIVCFDFNVSPGVAIILQEQPTSDPLKLTGVLGEVYIPRNSNTPAVCRKLIADWGKHRGRVLCYGDATGGLPGSAKVDGSDWDLIKRELKPVFNERLRFRVDLSNPAERTRVNCMNSRLRTIDGTVRLLVDGKKAPNLVKDFEGVRLLEGGSGEIDKKFDSKLTHPTDALGYYVEKQWPIQTGYVGGRSEQVI